MKGMAAAMKLAEANRKKKEEEKMKTEDEERDKHAAAFCGSGDLSRQLMAQEAQRRTAEEKKMQRDAEDRKKKLSMAEESKEAEKLVTAMSMMHVKKEMAEVDGMNVEKVRNLIRRPL